MDAYQSTFDFIADVFDEVALEGLDGITLSALWIRLAHRPGFNISLDDNSKAFLWRAISIRPELDFYRLPEPRPLLILFNRYDHRDPETGMCLEIHKENAPEDIYPLKMIDEKNKEFRGSCATFESRKCVTNLVRNKEKLLMAYDEVVGNYGETLVVVASQKMRTKLLMGLTTDPQLELSNIQYVMLEMIARAREHGIITTGQVCSFVGLKESPKSLFYHRKLLMKKQLIKRQLHFQRNKSTTQWGFVFHLPRFYVERPTAVNLMLQRLCTILQNKPSQREQFATLRSEAGIPETTFKKILARGQPLSQFTEVLTIKYREMYPGADDTEALSAKRTERVLKVVQLVKPFSWNSLLEEGEADEDDEEFDLSFAKTNGCDAGRLMLIRPIVCQAYDILYDHSPEGLSERELQKLMGVTRLDARSICRYLTRANIVATYMKDKGRQRMTMYVIAEHLHMSQAHQSIVEERQKILDSEIVEENIAQNGQLTPGSKSVPVTLTNCIIRAAGPNSEENVQNSRSKSAKNQTNSKDQAGTPTKKADQDTSFNFYDKNLTARQLSRANFILETVRKQAFIDDIYKIQRALSEKELKEGCETKLDKRSVMTLVQKLANDGHIKSIITTLKLGDNVKKLHFVSLPEITQESHQVQSALQSAKLRLVGLKYTDTKKIYESTKKQPAAKNSLSTPSTSDEVQQHTDESFTKEDEPLTPTAPKAEWQNKTVEMKFQPSMGKIYGLLPKFCRAQVLHEFLFYLTRDYNGVEAVPQSSSCADEIMIIDEKDIDAQSSQPTVYSESKDWKMFLPPLPLCEGYPNGWCLVSDVLQRLPVSIFVQIVNTPFKIEGFYDFLNHPIKKHYLISDLPIKLRNSLLMSRRYIFHITEILAKLSYMGLVSFGPQIHKDKDQVYIYVHQMASVLDTTISDPGHYTISPNREYNLRYHVLTSLNNVHNYWIDMKTVCLNTPLGRKITDHDDPTPKPNLRVECKTIGEIVDEGNVPGDHCGAGGIDSSLCSYLKRNWQLSQPIETMQINYYKKKKLKEKNSNVPLSLLLNQDNQAAPIDHRKRLNRLPKQSRTSSMLRGPSGSNSKEPIKVPVTIEKSILGPKNKPKLSMKRPMLLKSKKKNQDEPPSKKSKYDKKDYAAMSMMQRQRASWSSQEDTFLLLCKVASIMMGSKRIACSGQTLRDELAKHCKRISPKTSSACLRRFNSIVKNSKTKHFLYVMIEEARQLESLSSVTKSVHIMGSKEWNDEFLWILNEVTKTFTDKKSSQPQSIPSTYEELKEKFTISYSSMELTNPSNCQHPDPKNTVDVYCNAAFNLVLISVNNADLHTNWSYHLYKLFQQYPENLLRAVYTKMRRDRLISTQRTFHTKVSHHSTHPYLLSVSFKNLLNVNRYQSHIFDDGFVLYSKIKNATLNDNPYIHVSPNSVEGYGMVLQALISAKMVILRTEVPDQIIDVLDSNKPPPYKRVRTDKVVYTGSIRNNSEVTFSETQKSSKPSLPSSRLGLHLLRKKTIDTLAFNNIQHAGDCFVVNSCNISARIRTSDKRIIQPLNENCVSSWKKPKKIETDIIVDIHQFCEDEGIIESERDQYIAVYDAIQAKKSIGINHQTIYYGIQPIEVEPSELKKIITAFCERNLIVRVGVKSHMYVACEHAGPWVMQTLVVPKDKKSLAQPGSALPSTSSTDNPAVTSDNMEQFNASANVELSNDSSDKTDLVSVGSEETNESDLTALGNDSSMVGVAKRKRRTKASFSNSSLVFNESECVKMNVVGRPWHKPDGFINKKTLFSYLESLSSFISTNPGSSEEEIISHYTPYFQPVYILELLEMLQESGCITKGFLKKEIKNVGPFFSCSYDYTEEDGLYVDHESFYEPDADILLKVARMKNVLNLIE